MKKFNDDMIKEGMKKILVGLGLDLEDPNLKETPDRVTRSYYEILGGMIDTNEQVKKILSKAFPTKYTGIVTVGPIKVYSMCPHHFLPVIYEIWLGYIPRGMGLGLSKLPRLVELLAQRPVLQEDLTHEIVSQLSDTINPQGVAVLVKGFHTCMNIRGTKKNNSKTTTSEMSGLFLENKDGCKDEFFEVIKNGE